jgi:dihydrolipoamide dehydrogenase
MGLKAADVGFNLPRFQKHKERLVGELVSGVEKLCQLRKVKLLQGTAVFETPRQVRIQESAQAVSGDAFIVASGSVAGSLPIEGAEAPGVIDSTRALDIDRIPSSMVVIGGGYIGLEFAQIFSSLGAEVTVIEMLDRLVPGEDVEVSAELTGSLTSRGVRVITGAKVERIGGSPDGKVVDFLVAGQKKTLRAGTVMMAVGRRPNIEALGLKDIGVKLDRSGIEVNEHMETSVDGIFAIGDAVGGLMMAHVATAEGHVATDNILGREEVIDYSAAPRCIYTNPEAAAVGLNEDEARRVHGQIEIGRFPLHSSSKARIMGGIGFIKVITEKRYGRIIGVHLVGPKVTELIAEAALAINLECTAEELAHSIHPHPTISEALMEAAMGLEGYKINCA